MLPSKSHSRKNISLIFDKKQSFLKTCTYSPGLEGQAHSPRGDANLGHCGRDTAHLSSVSVSPSPVSTAPQLSREAVVGRAGTEGLWRQTDLCRSPASCFCQRCVLQQDVQPCSHPQRTHPWFLLSNRNNYAHLKVCRGLKQTHQGLRLNHMKLFLFEVTDGKTLAIFLLQATM